jgi:hypothetical protein
MTLAHTTAGNTSYEWDGTELQAMCTNGSFCEKQTHLKVKFTLRM